MPTGTPVPPPIPSDLWVSLQDATNYYGARFGIDEDTALIPWNALASDDIRTALLVTSQQDITSSNLFQWFDADGNVVVWDDDDIVINTNMQQAVLEQGLFRMVDPDLEDRQSILQQGVTQSLEIGERYDKTDAMRSGLAFPIAEKAKSLLDAFLTVRGRGSGSFLVEK